MNTCQHITMTCIVCPVGCRMTVAFEKGAVRQVSGHQCPRGEAYAIEEQTHPTRMLTTTVTLKQGKVTRLPVKTAGPVPKEMIHQCMARINELEVKGPVEQGQILLKNLLNTGVDLVATRSA